MFEFSEDILSIVYEDIPGLKWKHMVEIGVCLAAEAEKHFETEWKKREAAIRAEKPRVEFTAEGLRREFERPMFSSEISAWHHLANYINGTIAAQGVNPAGMPPAGERCDDSPAPDLYDGVKEVLEPLLQEYYEPTYGSTYYSEFQTLKLVAKRLGYTIVEEPARNAMIRLERKP